MVGDNGAMPGSHSLPKRCPQPPTAMIGRLGAAPSISVFSEAIGLARVYQRASDGVDRSLVVQVSRREKDREIERKGREERERDWVREQQGRREETATGAPSSELAVSCRGEKPQGATRRRDLEKRRWRIG